MITKRRCCISQQPSQNIHLAIITGKGASCSFVPFSKCDISAVNLPFFTVISTQTVHFPQVSSHCFRIVPIGKDTKIFQDFSQYRWFLGCRYLLEIGDNRFERIEYDEVWCWIVLCDAFAGIENRTIQKQAIEKNIFHHDILLRKEWYYTSFSWKSRYVITFARIKSRIFSLTWILSLSMSNEFSQTRHMVVCEPRSIAFFGFNTSNAKNLSETISKIRYCYMEIQNWLLW